MSTFIIHALIPPLMALAVRYVPFRYVWQWSWIAVVSDLDYIGWIGHVRWGWPNFHRALFHNVLILALLVGFLVVEFRRYRERHGDLYGGPAAFAQTPRGAAFLLAPYYYFSHLLLDLFQGGISPFWPLSTFTIAYEFELDINTATHEPIVHTDTHTQPTVVDVSPIYAWLDSEQFAFIMLLVTSLLLGWWYRRRTRTALASAAPLAKGPDQENP